MTNVQLLDENLPACQLGEGAFWDEATSSLYWVDILSRTVHRYSTAERLHQQWSASRDVSYAYPKEGRLVLCLSDGIYGFDPATLAEDPIARIQLPSGHRLNDGKHDPKGRLWVGTINTASEPSETAALYRLDGDRLTEVEGGYVNANGKVWSLDGKIMYHADTSRSTIWEYEYDLDTGTISNKRVFTKVDGSPDGLAIDQDGRVCAAIYGGARVEIYSPRGEVAERIRLPVPNPTSCVWGGANGKTLLVTSAFDGMTAAQRSAAPASGQVFCISF